MAGVRGLEPRSTVLETAVLILLDYTPIGAQREIRTLKTTFLKRVRLPIASPEHFHHFVIKQSPSIL